MRGHEAEIMELQALMEVWGGEMARMGARMLHDWIRRLMHLVVVCDVRRFLLGRIIPIRIRATEICTVIIGHMLLVLLIHRLKSWTGRVRCNEKWRGIKENGKEEEKEEGGGKAGAMLTKRKERNEGGPRSRTVSLVRRSLEDENQNHDPHSPAFRLQLTAPRIYFPTRRSVCTPAGGGTKPFFPFVYTPAQWSCWSPIFCDGWTKHIIACLSPKYVGYFRI